MAFRRQPWNAEEKHAGGIIETHPEDYVQRNDLRHVWIEHLRFFTTNPSLYSVDLTRPGWPQVAHSEGIFSHRIFADPTKRSAFWGPKDSAPWVHHIGAERTGTGY